MKNRFFSNENNAAFNHLLLQPYLKWLFQREKESTGNVNESDFPVVVCCFFDFSPIQNL